MPELGWSVTVKPKLFTKPSITSKKSPPAGAASSPFLFKYGDVLHNANALEGTGRRQLRATYQTPLIILMTREKLKEFKKKFSEGAFTIKPVRSEIGHAWRGSNCLQ